MHNLSFFSQILAKLRKTQPKNLQSLCDFSAALGILFTQPDQHMIERMAGGTSTDIRTVGMRIKLKQMCTLPPLVRKAKPNGPDRLLWRSATRSRNPRCTDTDRRTGRQTNTPCHLCGNFRTDRTVCSKCFSVNTEHIRLDLIGIRNNATRENGGCTGVKLQKTVYVN